MVLMGFFLVSCSVEQIEKKEFAPLEEDCLNDNDASCVELADQYRLLKDYFEAAKYYGKACMLDNRDACLTVAKMYYEGEEIKSSHQACMNYAEKGCHLGSQEACEIEQACDTKNKTAKAEAPEEEEP